MSQVSKFRRVAAYVISGALLATAVPPVQAQPIPMSRDFAANPVVDQVHYRRGPVRHNVRRSARRGNQAAGAAAIIGALAIGAAAIASSQRSRQRTYYADPGYDDGYYGQPGAVYHNPRYAQPYYQPQPQHYYQQQPQYYQAPRQRVVRQPQIDSGSPYAVQQQRQQRGGRHYYNGQALPPGVIPPPTSPYNQAIPIPSNN